MPQAKYQKFAKGKRLKSAGMKGMRRPWQPARDIISPTTGKRLRKSDPERKVEHVKPSEYVPARVPDEEHYPKSLRAMMAGREKAAEIDARRAERRAAAEAAAAEAAARAAAKRPRAPTTEEGEGVDDATRFAADPHPLMPLTNDFSDDDVFVAVPSAVAQSAAAVAAERAAARRVAPLPEQKVNRPSNRRREDTLSMAAAAHMAMSGGTDDAPTLKEQGVDSFEALDMQGGVGFGERVDAPPALTAVPRVRVRLSNAEIAAAAMAGGSDTDSEGDGVGGAAAKRRAARAARARQGDGVHGVTPSVFRRHAALGYVEDDAEDGGVDAALAAALAAGESAPPGSDEALIAACIKHRTPADGETEEEASKRLLMLGFATAALKERGVPLPPAASGAKAQEGTKVKKHADGAAAGADVRSLSALAAAAKGAGIGVGRKHVSSAQRHRVMMAVSLARASCGVHVRQLRGGAGRLPAASASAAAVAAATRRRKGLSGEQEEGESDAAAVRTLREAVKSTAALDAQHPERLQWIQKGQLSVKRQRNGGGGGGGGGSGGGAPAAKRGPMHVGSLVEVTKGPAGALSSRGSAAGSRSRPQSISRRSIVSAHRAPLREAAADANVYARMARLAREQASQFEDRAVAFSPPQPPVRQ